MEYLLHPTWPVTLLRLWISCLLACGIPTSLSAATAVTWNDEAAVVPTSQLYDEATSTPIVSRDGVFYYAWVGADMQMYVGRRGSGTALTVPVWSGVQTDQYHVKPSLAIDRDGYLHVTGDMHNQPLRYYISTNPGDITSWTQVPASSFPARNLSYPEFFYDRDGELYFSFRHQGADGKGDHRGGVARYQRSTKTYAMLGGTAYADDARVTPTLVWGEGFGGEGNWYQQPRVRLFFDRNNRLHLTASVIRVNRPGPGDFDNQSHLIYAYSDDAGQTFRKITGEAIAALPLTVSNASIVVDRSVEQDIVPEHRIGVFADGQPVISYRLAGVAYARHWNGTTWAALTLPEAGIPATFVGRRDGTVVWYRCDGRSDGIFYLSNNGSTWTTLQAPAVGGNPKRGNSMPDWQFFEATGRLRLQFSFDNKDGTRSTNVSTFNLLPTIEVRRSAAAVANGGTDLVAETATSLTYDIRNLGSATLSTSPATLGDFVNCTATITTPAAGTLAAGGASALKLAVTPTASGPWRLSISIPSNDLGQSPYLWRISSVVPGLPDTTPPPVPLAPQVSNQQTLLPTLSGLTEPGAQISIYDGAKLVASVVANSSGAWSWTPTVPLTVGLHSMSVTATDAAGNTSARSPSAVMNVAEPCTNGGIPTSVSGDGSGGGSCGAGSLAMLLTGLMLCGRNAVRRRLPG